MYLQEGAGVSIEEDDASVGRRHTIKQDVVPLERLGLSDRQPSLPLHHPLDGQGLVRPQRRIQTRLLNFDGNAGDL